MTDITERLRETDWEEVSHDGYSREELVPINRDGLEAADEIDRLRAQLVTMTEQAEKLVKALEDCASDLKSEIEAQRGTGLPRTFDRDMQTVTIAYDAIDAYRAAKEQQK